MTRSTAALIFMAVVVVACGPAATTATKTATGASATTLLVLKGSTHLTFQATSRSKDGPALLAALRAVARKVVGSL